MHNPNWLIRTEPPLTRGIKDFRSALLGVIPSHAAAELSSKPVAHSLKIYREILDCRNHFSSLPSDDQPQLSADDSPHG
jgi:hypothetical protein